MNTEEYKNLTEEEWLDEILKEVDKYAPPEAMPKESLKMLLNARKGIVQKSATPKLIDLSEAMDTARNWIKANVGHNLFQMSYKPEQTYLKEFHNRYECIMSVIPDIGAQREYYLISVHSKTGKIVTPLAKGYLKTGETVELKKFEFIIKEKERNE